MIGRTTKDVADNFLVIERAAEDVGLKINEDKTKYLLSSRRESSHNRIGQNISIGNHRFEAVTEVTYDNDITSEIKRRIMLASRCLYGFSKMMRFKNLSRNNPYYFTRQEAGV